MKKLQKTDVVYGPNSIIEVIRAGRRKIKKIYTKEPFPKAWQRLCEFFDPQDFDVEVVSSDKLAGVAKTSQHMGVVAVTEPFVFQKELFNPKKNPKVLVLDGIQDVGNMGTILRTAHCTGFSGVVLSGKRCAQISASVIKNSAGFAEHLKIYTASDLGKALDALAASGYKVVLTVVQGGQDIKTVESEGPMCLVIGNEESGISQEILDKGLRASIPQADEHASLNAAIAAGIFMHKFGD